MLQTLFKNWRTTSAGATAVITGVVHLGFAVYHKQLTEADVAVTLIAIFGGAGLIAAGDAQQSVPKDPGPTGLS
jgi:hypothetical protein